MIKQKMKNELITVCQMHDQPGEAMYNIDLNRHPVEGKTKAYLWENQLTIS
jgi:hypothetical protein